MYAKHLIYYQGQVSAQEMVAGVYEKTEQKWAQNLGEQLHLGKNKKEEALKRQKQNKTKHANKQNT